MKNIIIDEFQKEKFIFQRVAEKLEILINELLREHNIHFHQINCRVKEEGSLYNKLIIKEGKYNKLSDITDIVGIRVITYLDSDVDLVADIIKNEFNIDTANSIDKRRLENDVFGYRSLHFVASFSDERCKLTEFKVIKDKKFEIQIRSILQHAWAEIEHDLGYKSSISVPDNFKRGFNRLAALLETADIEFDRLKKDLITYEKVLPTLIESTPNDIEINQASIISYAKNNAIIQEAIKTITSILNCGLNDNLHTNLILRMLNFLEFKTIDELNKETYIIQANYIRFVKELFELFEHKTSSISLLTPVHYLCLYIALDRSVFKEINSLYEICDTEDFVYIKQSYMVVKDA